MSSIEESIAELAIKIAKLPSPERPPMTTEQALERLAAGHPEQHIRELATSKLAEIRKARRSRWR